MARQLKANLIVAFSRAPVRQRVGTQLFRQFHLTLREQGLANEVPSKYLCSYTAPARNVGQINPVMNSSRRSSTRRCACTGCERFFTRTFQILALAQIADHGDHFAAVRFLQPGNNDGGIEPSGIRQHNFFRPILSPRARCAANFLIEQREQDRFLHVQPVFRLIEHDRAFRIHHAVRHFRSAMRRQAMHEDGVRSGLRKQSFIHLVAGKREFARRRILLLVPCSPTHRCKSLARRRPRRRPSAMISIFPRVSRATPLRFRHHRWIGFVAGRRRHANMRSDARSNRQQRMAHIVSVADICEFQAAQSAETLFERKKVR